MSLSGKQVLRTSVLCLFGVFCLVYSFIGIAIPPEGQTLSSRLPASGATSIDIDGTGASGTNRATDRDPVDLNTGLYVLEDDDIVVEDMLPIRFTRVYRNRDTRSRAFGIGTSQSYDLFLAGDSSTFRYVDLIMPDGGRIHYTRISPGTGHADGKFEHTTSPTEFYKSRLEWNGNGWDINLQDGSSYSFLACQSARRPGQCGMISYQDPHGRVLKISRDSAGNITNIVTSSKRGIKFTNDGENRITRARRHFGRVINLVSYQYDDRGRLVKVRTIYLDIVQAIFNLFYRLMRWPEPGRDWWRHETRQYTYDDSHQMLTIKAPDTSFTNEYDGGGRVIKQTFSDGRSFMFDYVLNKEGKVIQTDIIKPDGGLRRVTFNSNGYILSDTYGVGQPNQLSITYERQAGRNRILRVTVSCSPSSMPVRVTALVNPGETSDDVERRLLNNCKKESN